MKSLYQCEKCNKLFEEYEDAARCEEKHYIRCNINEWRNDDDMQHLGDIPLAVYSEGSEMPEEVIVKLSRTYWQSGVGEEKWKWTTEVYYQRAKVTGKPFGQHMVD